MPDSSAAIVIDIGTTNCKVTCFSCEDASPLGVRKFATPRLVPQPGAVDFDIEQLWQDVVAAISSLVQATPSPIKRISIASFGESGVFVNDDGEILTPMLAWYDRRGESFLSTLSDAQCERLYAITGLPPHSNYSALKMRWLLANYPLQQENIAWLHAPEVLLWRLTGEKRTDVTLASRTLCLDVQEGCWSREAAAIMQIPFDALMPLLVPGEVAGYVLPERCRQLGLSESVSVTLAGHDHIAGARALRLKPGEVLNSTGTTEGILLLNSRPGLSSRFFRDKLANGRYSEQSLYTLFASLPVGGYAIEWMCQTFRYTPEEIFRAQDNLLQTYLAGDLTLEEIPLFIPHLRGSGSPYKNRQTRGLLYGLGDALPLEMLVASVALGLTMEFAHCYSCFDVSEHSTLKVIGPASANPLWLQLKADQLQCPVEAIAFDEAVSVGALIIACPETALPPVHVAARYQPDQGRAASLRTYQQRWLAFYRLKLQQEGVISPEIP